MTRLGGPESKKRLHGHYVQDISKQTIVIFVYSVTGRTSYSYMCIVYKLDKSFNHNLLGGYYRI
jgi:hypothetical protein